MQLDHALILSAGLGTRMGEAGKILPKVIWPIFSKSLLELQLDYCVELGFATVYVNIHFLANEIKAHIEKIKYDKCKVIFLHEEPLLDSGGAIHNLASRSEINYQGNVLLVNADQFVFFDKKYFVEALSKLQEQDIRASLFGIKVSKFDQYNETVIENGYLKSIIKNAGTHDYFTYSGLGLVKLTGLKPVSGVSKFFQTVSNFKEEKIKMITPPKFEYWDFGTAEAYFKNILELASHRSQESAMRAFLHANNVDVLQYKNFIDLELESVDLEQKGNFEARTILLKSIRQII